MHYTTDRSQVRLKRKEKKRTGKKRKKTKKTKEKKRKEKKSKDYAFQRQLNEKPCTTPLTAHRCI